MDTAGGIFCNLEHTDGTGYDATTNSYYYGLYTGVDFAETSFLDLGATLEPQGYICEQEGEFGFFFS